ncbi:MAG: PASTA domain-containing protein [Gemmatimonadota bacterium]|nr:PASTA domain-containing protein [Gemmatimonadota bacterium]
MSFERRGRSRVALPDFRLPSMDRMRTPVGRAALVTVGMFIAGYFLAATWLFPAAEDPTDATFVDVPDLEGTDETEARAMLDEEGLAAVVATRLHHPDLISGSVVAQSPLPGQVARPGDTIRLTLSSGPEARIVPDLAGLAGAEATRLLRGLGFEVEIQERSGGGAGVLESDPPPGTRVYVPADIRLVVSRGAPIVDVPDLAGRHVDDVEAALEEAELQMGAIRYMVDAPQAPGRVVSQSPAAGSALRGGGFVSIVVAGEPPDSMAADLAGEDIPPPPGDTLPRPGGRPR